MRATFCICLIAFCGSVAAQTDSLRSFPNLDQNDDQVLTLKEYLGHDLDASLEKVRHQQFVVFDFDGDDRLKLSEFAAIPRNTAPKDRADLPSFYLDVVNEQMFPVLQAVPEKVSLTEWDPISTKLPWYLPHGFQVWDVNRDGMVTSQELDQQLQIAFGLIRPDGSNLRSSTGHVFYAFRFHQFLDRDGSGGLSAKELALERNYDLNAAEELIKRGDRNKNGELEAIEADGLNLYWSDVANEFLQRDKDFDGVLSLEDINAFPNWDQPVGMMLEAFDLDGSNTWELAEYCQSPAGNRLVDWAAKIRDTNDDGLLEFQEFWTAVKLKCYKDSTHCMGLAGLVFDRLDSDQNHKLDLDEMTFEVRTENLTTKHAFAVLDVDKSQELTIKEIIGHNTFIYPYHSHAFALADQDHTTGLNHEEFRAGVDWMSIRRTEHFVRQRLQPQFQQLDSDQDGRLSQDEWMAKNLGQQKLQDFIIQDFDLDQQLTFVEFCGLRGVAPYEHRGPVCDPVVQTLEKVLQQTERSTNIKTIVQLVNQNSVGIIPADLLIDDTEFEYDRDEIGISLATLFGLRSKSGASLRRPTGEVLNLRMYHNLDLNNDGRLSRDEVVTQHWQGPEKGAEIFTSHDLNQDEFLSLQELAFGRYCWLDIPNVFRSFDEDLNGFISEQELHAHLSSVDGPDRTFLMSAFDIDGDQQLSFFEFRRTPCANPLPRNAAPIDHNDDGGFSLQEYRSMFEDRYPGMTGLFFRHFDRNGDGTLEVDEHDFKYQLHEIPPDKAFGLLDSNTDGFLELAEISSFASKIPARTPAERHSRLMAVEEVYTPLDHDQDSRLSLQEYVDSAHIIPLRMVGRNAPLPVRNHSPLNQSRQPSTTWKPYVLVTSNVLVIVLVIVLIWRSRLSKAEVED